MGRTPATFVIIALNVVAFIVEVALGADAMRPSAASLIAVGGNHASLTLAGEPWRLVTAMFLHGGLLHLAMNMFCLYQARHLERLIGPACFLAVYLFAGLIGGLASLLRAEPSVSIGASGAVFGVFGAYLVVLVVTRHRLDADVFWAQIRSLGTFLAINLALGLMVPNIDMLAHVGGLVGGAAATWLLSLGPATGRAGPRAAGIAALGVALSAVTVASLPAPSDPAALLRDAAEVERAVNARYDAAWSALQRDELPRAEARRTLETEVLPPWRAMRARLERPPADLPDRFRPAVRSLAAYFGARQELYELLARAIGRATDAAVQEDLALLPRIQESVRASSEAATRELERLFGKDPP